MSDLEAVNRELAEIQDRLIALPADAFAERYALRTRQAELRDGAAEFRDDADRHRTVESLVQELAAQRDRLASIYEARMDMVSMAGGTFGDAGGTAGSTDSGTNRRIAEAQGARQIQARINQITDELARRGLEPPEEVA